MIRIYETPLEKEKAIVNHNEDVEDRRLEQMCKIAKIMQLLAQAMNAKCLMIVMILQV